MTNIGQFHKNKNPYLRLIHQDETAIVHEMYKQNGWLEEIFGSLVGHTKDPNTNGIPTLIELLTRHHLVFNSKKEGVDYINSSVKEGILKSGFVYFFCYFDENGKVFVADVYFYFGELGIVYHLSDDCVCYASYAHRIVVPATKTLGT